MSGSLQILIMLMVFRRFAMVRPPTMIAVENKAKGLLSINHCHIVTSSMVEHIL